MVIRKRFSEQLTEIHQHLLEMGMLTNESIYKAVKSLARRDTFLAEKVISEDKTINSMEISLEKKSFELIALQQPVGTDLRKIVTVMKASSDLERIGDHAVSIAKIALNVNCYKSCESMPEISQMGKIVNEMLRDVLSAYLAEDIEQARNIAARDNEVDQLHKAAFQKYIQFMPENKNHLKTVPHLLLASQHLERIGDYITNISEWIVYLKSGEIEDHNG